ncbi:MAG: DUF4832 domain-containing protein, partial [Cyanobacteria bacterium J06648_11]
HEYAIELIERFHTNHLSWISNYDLSNPVAIEHASEIQKALGYRFIIESASYSESLRSGQKLRFSLTAINEGNTPLYGDWPVEIALHDPNTRDIVWSGIVPKTDTQAWLPDEPVTIRGRLRTPRSLPTGEYVVSVSILDPAGNQPAVRFATEQYWNGGRHPLGKIGVNTSVEDPELAPSAFDDPATDRSLFYEAAPELTLSETAIEVDVPATSTVDYTVTVENTGNRPLAWRLVEQPAVADSLSILVVDDDDNDPDARQWYLEALSSLGHEVTFFEVNAPAGNGPKLNQMRRNDLVVWFSGDQYSETEETAGPNDRDERRLAKYLDGGGKLILSSQDYAYDQRGETTDFMRNYLGVDDIWSEDGWNTRQLSGSTVLTGLDNLDLSPTGGIYHDTLFAKSGRPIFTDAETGKAQAIATESTAYLAFPWEDIYNKDAATGVRVLDSLIDTLIPPDIPWLAIDDMHGGIDTNDSTDLALTLDATGYGRGDRLDATIEIWHNDPAQSPLPVPIAMDVI